MLRLLYTDEHQTFLVGPSASYVSGHRLVIDGGGPATSLLPAVG